MDRRPLLEVIGDCVWIGVGVAAVACMAIIVGMIWRPWA